MTEDKDFQAQGTGVTNDDEGKVHGAALQRRFPSGRPLPIRSSSPGSTATSQGSHPQAGRPQAGHPQAGRPAAAARPLPGLPGSAAATGFGETARSAITRPAALPQSPGRLAHLAKQASPLPASGARGTPTDGHNVDIVDTAGRPAAAGPSSTTSQDNAAAGRRRPQGAPTPSAGDKVDIVDTLPPTRPSPSALPRRLPSAIPRPMPIPTRLARPPEPKVGSGPSGPSEERVRELRDIRRRQLAGKAKEAGTDPGAGSTMAETGYSRSSSTQEQYLARGRILLNRYRVENDIHAASRDDVNPVDFVNWLLSMKPTLRPSTWRLYRLSVATTISALPHEETEAALSLLETDVVVHTRKKDRKKTDDAATEPLPSRRTSAGKEKRLPKDSFDKLTNYLRTQSRSQMAPVIRDWLIAGVWTGLRPNEWRMTDLEFRDDPAAPNGHRAWLYVLNAKATNGRGNGVVRTIDLSGVSREIVEAIQRMSERGARWAAEGSYIKTQKYCSQMLFRICERLFPHATRSFCFYSCRHQFVANMKSLMSPEEVSAMVGHGITMTAAENYGLRRSAWSAEDITERPAPVPEEVSLVKQRMGFFDERMRQRVAAGLTVPDLGQEEGEAISYPIG